MVVHFAQPAFAYLCRIRAGEREEDCPDPDRVHRLGQERGGSAGRPRRGPRRAVGQRGQHEGRREVLDAGVAEHRPLLHPDHGGEVQGGHEQDEEARLDGHGHLVGRPVHDEPVKEPAGAVEH